MLHNGLPAVAKVVREWEREIRTLQEQHELFSGTVKALKIMKGENPPPPPPSPLSPPHADAHPSAGPHTCTQLRTRSHAAVMASPLT